MCFSASACAKHDYHINFKYHIGLCVLHLVPQLGTFNVLPPRRLNTAQRCIPEPGNGMLLLNRCWLGLQETEEPKEKVVVLDSEEELDSKLKDDAAKLIVLLSTVTWCRPCKTLKRPLEVPVCHIMTSCLGFHFDLIGVAIHMCHTLLLLLTPYEFVFTSDDCDWHP